MDSQAQLMAIAKFAKQKLGQDKSGHGFDHLSRVVKMARRIATAMDQDPFVPVVAAYLHDTIDDKLVDNVDAAKEEVATFLTGLGLTADQVELIMSIISQMSFASTLDGNRPALPLPAKSFRTPTGSTPSGRSGSPGQFITAASTTKSFTTRPCPRGKT